MINIHITIISLMAAIYILGVQPLAYFKIYTPSFNWGLLIGLFITGYFLAIKKNKSDFLTQSWKYLVATVFLLLLMNLFVSDANKALFISAPLFLLFEIAILFALVVVKAEGNKRHDKKLGLIVILLMLSISLILKLAGVLSHEYNFLAYFIIIFSLVYASYYFALELFNKFKST